MYDYTTPIVCRKRRSAAVPVDYGRVAELFPVVSAKRSRPPLQDCQQKPCQVLSQMPLKEQLQLPTTTPLAPAVSASTVPKLPPSAECATSLTPQCLALLRDFDLNWEYGPCVGINRLQRWERAVRRGLTPPLAVRNLVLAHAGDPAFTECVWLSSASSSSFT